MDTNLDYLSIILLIFSLLVIIFIIPRLYRYFQSFKLPETYFWGWGNIKWFCKEFMKIYSGVEDSYFSKKRIESGIAFIILQWGLIHWLVLNIDKCTSSDLFIWSSIEATICGYVISKIEDSKKAIKDAQLPKE